MARTKIVFGNDLIKELKKYGLNKIGEVATKYKNGIVTINFMYSMVNYLHPKGCRLRASSTQFGSFDYE